MKFLFFIPLSVLGLFFHSCNNSPKLKEPSIMAPKWHIQNNYCFALDTNYEINSTKIRDIDRTFFIAGDTTIINDDLSSNEAHNISLSKKLEKDDYCISIQDGNISFGYAHMSERSLKDLLNNADTIFQNPSKRLFYTFGDSKIGSMILLSGHLDLTLPSLLKENDKVSYKLKHEELHSMKSCFNRFKSE